MKPIIRWAGSKRQILSSLKSYYPVEKPRYIEPFCGSGALFFRIEPHAAVLGDLNAELIGSLRAIQVNPGVVLECLHRLPTGKRAYYSVRAVNPNGLSDNELAARFLYLNHYCFNGLFRTNLQGRFNVPYGPPKSGRPIDAAVVLEGSKLLQQATLLDGDFEDTLAHARAGDFVYLDPPYVVRARRVFSEYLPHSFCQDDLGRLAKSLDDLDRIGAFFVVSYADSAEARSLFAKWSYRRIGVRRHIAGFAGARRTNYELIATNLDAEARHYAG